MNLKRCNNGHFYDGDKYSSCPHCAGGGDEPVSDGATVGDSDWDVETKGSDENDFGGDTWGADPDSGWPDGPTTPGFTQTGPTKPAVYEEDQQHTVSFYDSKEEFKVKPVVGWLVVVEGEEKGQSKNLYAGMNFIGRDKDMDVSLSGDKSISRKKHAVLTFEPKNRIFIAMPGESHELYYVNGNVILSQTKLEAYDRIQIGKTELIFVPFCGDKFGWDDGDKEEA